MSVALDAWTAAGALAAAAGVAGLWRAALRRAPAGPRGQRWLAVAAALWGAALIAQDAQGTPVSGAALAVTPADLLAILALPALVAGVAAQRPPKPEAAGSRLASGDQASAGRAGTDPAGAGPAHAEAADAGPAGTEEAGGRPAGSLVGTISRIADGSLLAISLFIVCWVTMFAADFGRSGVSSANFAAGLVRPAADLVALGALLAYAIRAGRRGRLPTLALLVMTVADALAVGAKTRDSLPGPASLVLWVAALCLLGLTASDWLPRPRRQLPASLRRMLGTLTAVAAAAVAALVTVGWALSGGSAPGHVLPLAVALTVLVLAVQAGCMLSQTLWTPASSAEPSRQFRELADHTSDVVLVCDLDGSIRYASPGAAVFGYPPAQLTGRTLAELVHPEDRPAGIRAALAALRAPGQAGPLPDRFPCRVRSADGTWRHVESTVARYREAGGPGRLLVTVRDVSDKVALRRQVTHLTFHDGLTGLPNRTFLDDRVKSLLASGMAGATGAIFLDLDGFTGVNDSIGHGAGDLLLAQAGRRLRAAVPQRHTVARWGGDEFAVLVEASAGAREIVDIAERLAGGIAAEPFRVAGREVSLTASVGVALADPATAEHLLRNADVAMARAKEAGGGRVEVFAAHMHADVVRRLELASDLRRAISDGKLSIDYQPLVHLGTRRLLGVEALVRWTRDGEQVAPAEFLGVAEEAGLIDRLGDWVLREACARAAAWRQAGLDLQLAVNFSLRQVSAARFTDSVLAEVMANGLPPEALTLEVTERVLIDGSEPMLAGLAELRRQGVRLAIDDFGTGYASLAYLRRLPVDIVKIDPSFVAGLGTDTTLAMLTRTIVRVGHDLGIEVVAEGIERPEQLDLLRAMGCELGQGYLIARPTSPAGVEAFAAAADPALGSALPAGSAPLPGSQGSDQEPATYSQPARAAKPVPAPQPAPSPQPAHTSQ
ncbi:MAG TPA: bifunctional diguanylate cyclase/phosphodiesterase [Streptosporangiaceae bacterium]|jgi:diguanylate cyclase (GGDEF)-like protein/PAS domain S-box-containing protein